MYTTILCFLIAVTIHVLAPQNPEASWSIDSALLMVGVLVASWLFIRTRMRRKTLSALSEERQAAYLRPRFTMIVQDNQTLLLAPFAFFTYATDYNSLIVLPAARYSQAVGGLLGLAPYLLMWLLLWWEAYPLKSVLFGPGDTRPGFVKSHARMETAALAPWFVLLALGDLLTLLWPGGSKYLDTHPIAQLFYAPLFLGMAAIFMPLLVKRIWGCTPVPPGPLRDRLEADVARLGLKLRGILSWPLLGGRLITAGIVGPVARYRYLLITPALASLLDADEMGAVVAHETGHIRYNHLWFYLLYFSGLLVGGLALFFQLSSTALVWWSAAFPETAQAKWANSVASLALTIGMGTVIFLGFRILFGRLSRAFERQADLFALEAFGRPGPVISALEAISSHSGEIRDLPSWHHGSLTERIRFLSRAALDPLTAKAHHRAVARLKRTTTIAILFLFALAAAAQIPAVEKKAMLWSAEKGGMTRVGMHPEDWKSWTILGDLRLDQGRDKEALEAYMGSIRANPSDYNALNNAAWVLCTTSDSKVADPALAVELASRAVELMPAPYILDTLAQALFADGDVKGAVGAMERALAETPAGAPGRGAFEEKLLRMRSAQR